MLPFPLCRVVDEVCGWTPPDGVELFVMLQPVGGTARVQLTACCQVYSAQIREDCPPGTIVGVLEGIAAKLLKRRDASHADGPAPQYPELHEAEADLNAIVARLRKPGRPGPPRPVEQE